MIGWMPTRIEEDDGLASNVIRRLVVFFKIAGKRAYERVILEFKSIRVEIGNAI